MKKITILFLVILGIAACNNSSENTDEIKNQDTSIAEIKRTETTDKQDNISGIQKSVVPEGDKVLKRADEEVVFSFETEKGKTMNILLQKEKKYMVYRFGTKKLAELQFPDELSESFKQFTYNYYFRGGGSMNEGLDLNYLSFTGDTHKFIVYEEHSYDESGKEDLSVGIRIIDPSSNKEIKIKGVSSTVKGSLIDFRDNSLVKVVEGEI